MIFLIFVFLFIHLPFQIINASDPYQEPEYISYTEKEGFTLLGSVEHLRIGGYLQADGVLFLGPNPSKSTFWIRRARLFMTGTLYKTFGFMVMPAWDLQTNINLHYAWIETLHPSWAQIRVGLFKKPFSLEALTSNIFLNFVERSLIIRNFCQIEDIGIMVYGNLFDEQIAYSLGAFNGRGKRIDNNNNKEIVGRLVYRLFNSPLFGSLYLGISGSAGRQDEDLSGIEFTTEEFTPFWRWTDDSIDPVEVRSHRIRWGADLEWLVGPFYFTTEYLYTNWGKIHMGSRSEFFEGYGGYAQCSYLFTGETKPRNQAVIPKHNFDPCKDHWGAFELAVKYEIFYASKKMIKKGFAEGANYLHGPILGFNWYFNPRVLMRLDGQYLWFNRTVTFTSKKFSHETVFVCRVQAVF